MRVLNTQHDSPDVIRAALLPETAAAGPEVEAAVREILQSVRTHGDAAVVDCIRRFDRVEVDVEGLEVPGAELTRALDRVDPEFLAAVDLAAANIRRFHEQQRPESWSFTSDGAWLGQRVLPLKRVGVVVPAGKAPLPSSLLMAAIPAQVAGVAEILVCSSPQRDGAVDPHILAAAARIGLSRVFRMGGAQAVGALAFGTRSVPRVDKIVGPGNPYTVEAKRQVFGQVGIESLPGPTEVVVIADGSADPGWIAADLLSQAEHGADSLVALLTPDPDLARRVIEAVERQVGQLSRAAVARQCLEERGVAVIVRDLGEACVLSDHCAPEHLELLVEDPDHWLDRLHNAGAIFIGPYTPEPVGDYVAGPSHILPTAGTARFSSPLNVDDFVKKTSLLRYSRERFEREAPHIIRLAEAETLDGHAHSVRIRLQ
jgi:histidinol dehydrogenase